MEQKNLENWKKISEIVRVVQKEYKELEGYKDFFLRALKPGNRGLRREVMRMHNLGASRSVLL